jgi:hypothetical protein
MVQVTDSHIILFSSVITKKTLLFVNLNLFQILFSLRRTHNHQLSQQQLSTNSFPLWHPFLWIGQGIGKLRLFIYTTVYSQ